MIDEETGKPKPAYRIYKSTPGLRLELDRCPAAYLRNDVRVIRTFRLYGHYSQGRFPIAGGVMDQSVTALDAFEIIEDCLAAARKG